jgi:hypothetical protein
MLILKALPFNSSTFQLSAKKSLSNTYTDVYICSLQLFKPCQLNINLNIENFVWHQNWTVKQLSACLTLLYTLNSICGIILRIKAWFHERFFSAKCELFRLFLLNCDHSNKLFILDCSQFKRNMRNISHFAEKKRPWNQALRKFPIWGNILPHFSHTQLFNFYGKFTLT